MSAGFQIHGHRGARGRYPENTVEGLVAALADGADALETDLLMTADGVVVLHHDLDLNPDTTRDESGRWLERRGPPIATLPYQAIARLDVGRLRPGSPYAALFPEQRPCDGARVPTLAAAFEAVDRASGGRARWSLEIKIATEEPALTAEPERVADAAVALVREHGLAARTMIQSFDWRVVRRVQAIAPEIATGCLTSERTVRRGVPGPSPYTGHDLAEVGGSVPRLVHAAGASYWTPDFRMIQPGEVDLAHQLGLRVVPWTVNDPPDLARIVALGVDGLITDYPDRLARAVD